MQNPSNVDYLRNWFVEEMQWRTLARHCEPLRTPPELTNPHHAIHNLSPPLPTEDQHT